MASENANGVKAVLGTLGAMLAVVAGVWAMVAPMGQRIDFQNDQISQVREQLYDQSLREREDKEALAAMSERFREVETQFSGMREVLGLEVSAVTQRLSDLEAEGNPRHDERIKSLEQKVLVLEQLAIELRRALGR